MCIHPYVHVYSVHGMSMTCISVHACIICGMSMACIVHVYSMCGMYVVYMSVCHVCVPVV